MLFNSIDFAIFLPICLILYWVVLKNNKDHQNIFLLLASYFFYAYWDIRFLSLIIINTLSSFFIGQKIFNKKTFFRKKQLLFTGILINLSILFVFKYFNFFIDSLHNVFTFFGFGISPISLNLVLPVGISFYTFQTISYLIDIYRKKLKPTKSLYTYAAFVSFFPQLVAGPIERATNLIPQFNRKRVFSKDDFVDGLRQILWGLFKKVVIADTAAAYVNLIFKNYTEYSGSTLFLGAFLFAFQIYGDFSGYSDIAIGVAKLFSFKLMQNFSAPYFSSNIREFWGRWHISLSTWFRDYLYIPLGGNRKGKLYQIRNILIVFLASGMWHGANWTFVVWGLMHGLLFIPSILQRDKMAKETKNKQLKTIKNFIRITSTFIITTLAWVFFRSDNLIQAVDYFKRILMLSLFSIPNIVPSVLLILIGFLMSVEWINKNKDHGLNMNSINYPRYNSLRWVIYLSIALIIFTFGNFKKTEFIYFAF